MKIRCDKCERNLSILIDQRFEQNMAGRINCPECGKKQARYLTRFDINIYLVLSCLTYVFVAYLSVKALDYFGRVWWLIVLLLMLYVLVYIFLKSIDRLIYINPPFKKAWMNKEIYDDKVNIKIKLRFEFMLYFALILMMCAGVYDYYIFLILALVLSLIILVNCYFIFRKEKNANKL